MKAKSSWQVLAFPFIEVDNFSQEEQFDLFHQVAEESVNSGPSPEESFQQDYDLDVDWLDVCFDTVQHVLVIENGMYRL